MDAPNATPSAPATAVAVDDDGPETATARETTMKAIVHSRYGAPDVLELKDIDKPVINDDAVLVRVHAAAVGKGDWLTVRGLPYIARMRYGLPKPKHPVPGFDVAGRIAAVGSNVTQLQPGDEVFGWCEGSFAEYASVPEGQLVLKPANLTFEQAAAVPISAFAALQALRDTGQVQPGQQVMIIGASGGVGSFAVQLAKAFGAEVTGVCSTKSVEIIDRGVQPDQSIYCSKESSVGDGSPGRWLPWRRVQDAGILLVRRAGKTGRRRRQPPRRRAAGCARSNHLPPSRLAAGSRSEAWTRLFGSSWRRSWGSPRSSP
jgi:hypothetical protein